MARRLEPTFVPKLWGSTQLEPWFRNTQEEIGEVWYPYEDLLLKFLFTTENLSVQVHPDDEYAARHHQSRGKTEMWHILRAEAGAQVALGFKQPLQGREDLRQASVTGAVMHLLNWVTASPGDTFFVPAGTVHAIGAGLALCEIQQNSDVTYRLFDYGRDRELHLEHGVRVAHLGTHEGSRPPAAETPDRKRLAGCRYFETSLLEFPGAHEIQGADLAVILSGEGCLGGAPMAPGQVWDLSREPVIVEAVQEARILLVRRP